MTAYLILLRGINVGGKRQIEDAPSKAFRLDSDLVAVVVLTRAQLQAVVDNKPKGFDEHPELFYSDAIFLMGIHAATAMQVFDPRPDVDRVWPGDGVIYSQRLSAQRTRSRPQQGHKDSDVQVDDHPQLDHDHGTARIAGSAD